MTESFHKELSYGSKTLSLNINDEKGTASMRFGTGRTDRKSRIPGETTCIYLLAEAIICQWVNTKSKEITLRFDTANTNLKKWARFHQEDLGFCLDPEDPNSWRVTVEKTFSPGEPPGN